MYWKKIINKMYDRDDVRTLTQRFMDTILMKKSANSGFVHQSMMSSVVLKENKNTQ
jgi:PBP1b-binding outer membrane lipoprotein LpoB